VAASDHLNPQQFSPAEVGGLHAGDFPGSIGDQAARSRFERYNNADSLRASHREAGGPLPYLDHFTDQVRKSGKIDEPIVVDAHDDYFSIHDGHHRAMAAHAAGLPLPYRIRRDDRYRDEHGNIV
jgi:hypothetical protein